MPALLAVIAGAGWPAALYPSQSIALGAMILVAALWVLAGLRTTRPAPALVAGAVLVVVAAGASSSAAVAKDGVLAWERWSPSGIGGEAVSVRFVWNANYGGISFPKKKTTVLRITGPKRGLYWRATTLDNFDSDSEGWIENPTPLSTGPARGRLPEDSLLPARAGNRRTWVRQDVEVIGLSESRVVAAAQPVALDGPQLGTVFRLSDGIVHVQNGLRRGTTYTVYSYAPRPGPAELAGLPAEYPAELERFLDVGRTRVDPFGTPGRDELVDGLFEDERYLALWPYEAMWERARLLRADARTPYGAVVAIETWLRSTGGFTYDESPPTAAGVPPLAHFVADGKRGYCQHFAGAMALMLRMLGVPARVAAGFTSGTFEDGGWTVTDHNAHTWVEVWFPGYGWLPFDPTPGRGSLAARYSASSTGFNAGDAAEAFGGATGGRATGGGVDQLELLEQKERLAAQAEAQRRRPRREHEHGLAPRPARVRRRRRARPGQARAAAAALPHARSAAAGRRGPARARRLPRRPGDRGRCERDPGGAARARALGARRRRPAVRAGAGGSPLRPARRQRRSCGEHAARASRAPAPAPPPARPPGSPARAARVPLAADVIPAVVIAAGLGTRLRPLTERYAKPVLPLDGQPVIARLLRDLAGSGCERATVVTGHLAEQVETLLGDGSGFGVEVRYVRQPEPAGSADAVRRAGRGAAVPRRARRTRSFRPAASRTSRRPRCPQARSRSGGWRIACRCGCGTDSSSASATPTGRDRSPAPRCGSSGRTCTTASASTTAPGSSGTRFRRRSTRGSR